MHVCVCVINIHAQYASGVCLGVCVSSHMYPHQYTGLGASRICHTKAYKRSSKPFCVWRVSRHVTSICFAFCLQSGTTRFVFTLDMFIHLKESIMLLSVIRWSQSRSLLSRSRWSQSRSLLSLIRSSQSRSTAFSDQMVTVTVTAFSEQMVTVTVLVCEISPLVTVTVTVTRSLLSLIRWSQSRSQNIYLAPKILLQNVFQNSAEPLNIRTQK
jgi:hypothetical protein